MIDTQGGMRIERHLQKIAELVHLRDAAIENQKRAGGDLLSKGGTAVFFARTLEHDEASSSRYAFDTTAS